MVELYLYSAVCLHGIVLSYLSTGTALPLITKEEKGSTSWDITPCSPLKVNPLFGGTCSLHFQGQIISQARSQICLIPASYWFLAWIILRSSETSVDFQRTTRRYIPEDRVLLDQRNENLKSDKRG
jgi:hypothetical protein